MGIQQISTALPKTWNPIANPRASSIFSVDEMIDAYVAGLQDGLSVKRSALTKIKENLSLIKEAGEGFFKFLNDKETYCHSIFLKFNRINSFNLIYALNKDLYSDDDAVRPIYQKSWKITQEFKEKNISINISFIPFSENINTKRLISDGYTYFYGELQES